MYVSRLLFAVGCACIHWLTPGLVTISFEQIQVYGACVASLSGGVNRFACDKEFSKLRECFQRAAKKKK